MNDVKTTEKILSLFGELERDATLKNINDTGTQNRAERLSPGLWDRLVSVSNAAAAGMIDAAAGSTVDLGSAIARYIKAKRGKERDIDLDDPFTYLSNMVHDFTDQRRKEYVYQPPIPKDAPWYAYATPENVAQALGSMVGFMLPGAAVSKALNTGAMALAAGNGMGRFLTAKALTASTGGITEGLTEGVNVFNDVLKRTGDEDEAALSAAKTIALNIPIDIATNLFGLASEHRAAKNAVASALKKAGMGKITETGANKVASMVTQALSGVASEGAQETMQAVVSEKYGGGQKWGEALSAQNIREKALTEGLVGGISGGITGAGFSLAGRGTPEGKTVVKDAKNAKTPEDAETPVSSNAGAADSEALRIQNAVINGLKEIRAIPRDKRSEEDIKAINTYKAILSLYDRGEAAQANEAVRGLFDIEDTDDEAGAEPIIAKERLNSELAPADKTGTSGEVPPVMERCLNLAAADMARLNKIDWDDMPAEDRRRKAMLDAAADSYAQGDMASVANIVADLYLEKALTPDGEGQGEATAADMLYGRLYGRETPEKPAETERITALPAAFAAEKTAAETGEGKTEKAQSLKKVEFYARTGRGDFEKINGYTDGAFYYAENGQGDWYAFDPQTGTQLTSSPSKTQDEIREKASAMQDIVALAREKSSRYAAMAQEYKAQEKEKSAQEIPETIKAQARGKTAETGGNTAVSEKEEETGIYPQTGKNTAQGLELAGKRGEKEDKQAAAKVQRDGQTETAAQESAAPAGQNTGQTEQETGQAKSVEDKTGKENRPLFTDKQRTRYLQRLNNNKGFGSKSGKSGKWFAGITTGDGKRIFATDISVIELNSRVDGTEEASINDILQSSAPAEVKKSIPAIIKSFLPSKYDISGMDRTELGEEDIKGFIREQTENLGKKKTYPPYLPSKPNTAVIVGHSVFNGFVLSDVLSALNSGHASVYTKKGRGCAIIVTPNGSAMLMPLNMTPGEAHASKRLGAEPAAHYELKAPAYSAGYTFPNPFSAKDPDMEITKAEPGRKGGFYLVGLKGRTETRSYTEEELKNLIKQGHLLKEEKERADREETERKEREEREKAEKEKQKSFNGFTDNMRPMEKERTAQILNKQYIYSMYETEEQFEQNDYERKVMTRGEYIETYVKKDNYFVKKTTEKNGIKYSLNNNQTSLSNNITKTEYDYFNYLRDKQKKEAAKPEKSKNGGAAGPSGEKQGGLSVKDVKKYVAEECEKNGFSEQESENAGIFISRMNKRLCAEYNRVNNTTLTPEEFFTLNPVSLKKDEKGNVSVAVDETYYQPVYHGTPHKFERFSTEHIGEGEGAQAYGWGLYFTEDREIAEWYREKLLKDADTSMTYVNAWWGDAVYGLNGWMVKNNEDEEFSPADPDSTMVKALNLVLAADENSVSVEKIIKEFEKYIKDRNYDSPYCDFAGFLGWLSDEELQEVLEELEDGEFRIGEAGQLFKAEVPDDTGSNYLYWDENVPDKAREKILRQADKEKLTAGAPVLCYDGEVIDKRKSLELAKDKTPLSIIKREIFYLITDRENKGKSIQDIAGIVREGYREGLEYGKKNLESYKFSGWDKGSKEKTAARAARIEKIESGVKENEEILRVLDDEKIMSLFTLKRQPLSDLISGLGECSGKNLYDNIKNGLRSAREASLFLNRAGFDGIKYATGNTRGRGDKRYNYVIFNDEAIDVAERYYQPLNADVDLDGKVSVVDLSGIIPDARGMTKKDLLNAIRGMAPVSIAAADNKAVVSVLKSNAKHIAHSSLHIRRDAAESLHNAAVTNIQNLIRSAVLIESIPNKKITPVTSDMSSNKADRVKRKNAVAVYHRLYVPVTDGKSIYTMRLVVEEKQGSETIIPRQTELYDVITEDVKINNKLPIRRPHVPSKDFSNEAAVGTDKKPTGVSITGAPQNVKGAGIPAGAASITVRDMLSGVADYDGNLYEGRPGGGAYRGYTAIPKSLNKGNKIRIVFGENSDPSTLLHESAHYFLSVLRNIGRNGPVEDLDIISRWWEENAEDIAGDARVTAEECRAWLKDAGKVDVKKAEALDTAAQEYFARGFEAYVMEGKAPTSGLKKVFERFKQWLLDIYRNISALDVKLSGEIRSVFDRMLAEGDQTGQPDRIEDFGEKIGGARKDRIISAYLEDLSEDASDKEIASLPLSKILPEMNYGKMLNEGVPPEAVAVLHALRDSIPAKTHKHITLYAASIRHVKPIMQKILSLSASETDTESFIDALRKKYGGWPYGDSPIFDFADLYLKLGHDRSMKKIRIRKVTVPVHRKTETRWYIREANKTLAEGATREEAIDNFAKSAGSRTKGRGTPDASYFGIYAGKEHKFFIAKRIRSAGYSLEYPLAGPFDSPAEAHEYRESHMDELYEKWKKARRTSPKVRREENKERAGKDLRHGKDATPEIFTETFGFRGVEFGNWVSQETRQKDLNEAFDALSDLADILNIPTQAISLNGELGLAFGARGRGGKHSANAHYEPYKTVINLTKEKGAGSLAHEWWHALDNYFNRHAQQGEYGVEYMSESGDVHRATYGAAKTGDNAARQEIIDAFAGIQKALEDSGLIKRSVRLDRTRSKPYWSTRPETGARAFEAYIIEKLKDSGASNDYLANILSEEEYHYVNEQKGEKTESTYPYPTKEEMPRIKEAFDALFRAIKVRTTEKGMEMYKLAYGKRSAMAKLEADSAAFAQQVDRFTAKKMQRLEMLTVMQTPLVLQISDENVKALPVVLSQSNLRKIMIKHKLTPDMIKQLPKALADPIMVLRSQSRSDSLVVMLPFRDNNGSTVMAAIELNAMHKDGKISQYVCNEITSTYGREQPKTGVPNDEWFVKQASVPGRLKYINTKKYSRWVSQATLLLRGGQLIRNIAPSVKTEEDLVKTQNKKSAYNITVSRETDMEALPPVDVENIRKRVKGAVVSETPDGHIKIAFNGGRTILVDMRAESIPIDPEIIKRDYGREVSPEDVVAGRTRIINGKVFIDLVSGMSNIKTFSHEIFEAAWGLLSDKEQEIILQKHGDTESAADAYAEFLEGRVGKLTGGVYKIFQRIRDFFSDIRASLFGANSEDVFRRIESGEAFSREQAPLGNDVRYSAQNEHLKKLDADYFAAIEQGDMETAQDLVDEAAALSGLPIIDDSAATAYIVRRAPAPQKTIHGYKLFTARKGKIFPLFVGAKNSIPMGIWLDAKEGKEAARSKTGKRRVKSKLGALAFRPGWHAADLPLATHIGAKDKNGKIWARRKNEIWVEAELAADKDYQPEANANGRTRSGKILTSRADIKHMPVNGYYRYKTNPDMTGNWIISGSIKINKILSEEEVNGILQSNNISPMPWKGGALNLEKMGLKDGETINKAKLRDVITRDDNGDIIPLSKRFNPLNNDVRYKLVARIKEEASLLSGKEIENIINGPVRTEAEQSEAIKEVLKAREEMSQPADGLERTVSPSRQNESVLDKIEHMWHEQRNTFYRQWTDRLNPLKKHFGEEIFHDAEDALYGAQSRAARRFHVGDPDKGVKGLFEIMSPINKNERQDFAAYTVLKHLNDIAANNEKIMRDADELIEKAKAKRKEIAEDMKLASPDKEALSEWKKRIATLKAEHDLYVSQARTLREAVKYIKGSTAEYSSAVAEIEARHPEWRERQQELVKYNQALLDMLADKDVGIISQEMCKHLKELYPNYVPLQRDFGIDDESVGNFISGMGLVNVQSPLKKLRGSKRDVVDPLEQIVKNTFQFELVSARQKVGHRVMKEYDNGNFKDLIEEVKDRHHEPDETVWSVWDNGKKRFFKSDRDIYEALIPSRTEKWEENIIFAVSRWAARTLRAGTVHGLTYALRNPVRDTFSYAVIGENFRPVIDTIRGLMMCFDKSAGSVFDEFMKYGGEQGMVSMSRNQIQEFIKELQSDKNTILLSSLKNPPKAVYDLIGKISGYGELASRLGQFERAKAAGKSPEEAARIARDNMNFMRSGTVGAQVSRHVAFFNAAIQGVDKMCRTFYGGHKLNKKAIARAALYITLPSLMQLAYNYGDDDRKERYRNLPAWRKNTFWNFVMGKDGPIISIPKPFELGMVFGSIPERIMEYCYGHNKRVFNGVMSSAVSALAPEPWPNLLLLMAEMGANYSFFYQRPIVPAREQRFEPALQYGPYTAEWAKATGKMFNISPRILEHVAFSIGGGLAKEVSNVSDVAVRKIVTNETRPEQPLTETLPGVRGFFARTTGSGAAEEAFQSEADMLKRKLATAEEILKTQGRQGLSGAQKRLLQIASGIKRLTMLNTGKNGIYALHRTIREISTAKNLSAVEKNMRIKRAEERIHTLSEYGLARIDKLNAWLDK